MENGKLKHEKNCLVPPLWTWEGKEGSGLEQIEIGIHQRVNNISSLPNLCIGGDYYEGNETLSIRGRMCGVRESASSPPSSGMLNRVHHLSVHLPKLCCKENEEIIVGVIQSHPWVVKWPTIRFPRILVNIWRWCHILSTCTFGIGTDHFREPFRQLILACHLLGRNDVK